MMSFCHAPFAKALALTLTYMASQSAMAAPVQNVASDELLARISDSFSEIPMSAQLKEVEMPLAEIRYSNCSIEEFCWVENADRVRHIFDGPDRRLSEKLIKWINGREFSDKPIGALDIGLARKKDDVAKKISLFLNEEKYECVTVSNWQGYLATVYAEESLCRWKLRGGEVSATFYDYDEDGILLDGLAFKRITE
jgi:hypothetical protein